MPSGSPQCSAYYTVAAARWISPLFRGVKPPCRMSFSTAWVPWRPPVPFRCLEKGSVRSIRREIFRKRRSCMNRRPVVTIDGPAGAGKSTISRLLAERLSFIYLETGALYRAVALRLRSQGWDGREDSLAALCRNIRVEMRKVGDRLRVFTEEDDVTEKIRSEEIGLQASRVSAVPAVREMLLSVQKEAAAGGGVVAEGRDMGSVVFPDAEVKFFLDASAEERAKRRYLELTAKGEAVHQRDIEEDLLLRDRQG